MNNTDKRFKTIAAALILLTRRNAKGNMEYLLQKRQNTGFADGMWDFSASGHVEKDEPMIRTVCREAKEEIGIDVNPEKIEFMGLIHEFGNDRVPRFLGCFRISDYSGEVKIGEPEKIAELKWFDEGELPENIISSRKVALDYFKGEEVFYKELGWH